MKPSQISYNRFSCLDNIKQKDILPLIKETDNVDLLMEIRDSYNDYERIVPTLCAGRLNQIALQKYSEVLTLATRYEFIPNSLCVNDFISMEDNKFYPEILKIFTYMPRSIVEYMCYYSQLVIYPIIHNKNKYKIFVENDIACFGKYYMFPFTSTKEEIYEKSFLDRNIKSYCQSRNYNFIDYSILGFYNLRFEKETEFKIIMFVLIETDEEDNMCTLEEIKSNWLDICSEKILKFLKGSKKQNV